MTEARSKRRVLPLIFIVKNQDLALLWPTESIMLSANKAIIAYGAYFRTKLKLSIHYLKHHSLFNAL